MLSLLRKLMGPPKRPHPRCAVVVPAAGTGTRMGGEDKILRDLGGKPVLAHTLIALNSCSKIDEIIVVTREDLLLEISKICKDFQINKATKVLVGGDTRTKSVLIGLHELNKETQLVAIHDGARPLLTQSVLDEVLSQGERTHAAAPAIPLVDTIKQGERNIVERTLDRSTLWAVQTPQVFDLDLIKVSLAQALKEDFPLTDDCSAVERLGTPVTLTHGDQRNIKITTPLDLITAESFYAHFREDFL